MSRDLSTSRDPLTVAVLVPDPGSLFETSVPLAVFGVDRSDAGVPRFEVLPFAEPGRPRTAGTTAGVRLTVPHGPEAMDRAGTVIVPTWRTPPDEPHPRLLDGLRRAHDEGATVVGLCLGAFVLAGAGLLDGRSATTHWLCTGLLAERHPQVDVRPDVLFVDEGTVLTAAGSAAGLDACLHLLGREHGTAAAAAVARRMVVPLQRAGGQAQFIDHPMPAPDGDCPVARTLHWALEHLSQPLEVAALAARAHLSRRSFDRRFRAVTGQSPHRWVLDQRVLRARRLLESCDLSVEEIARSSGFSSAVALRPHFRRISGLSPTAYRQTFGGPASRPAAGGRDGRPAGGTQPGAGTRTRPASVMTASAS